MKYISFSLWGTNEIYTRGVIENIKLRDEIYSDWNIVIHHDNSVPISILEEIKQYNNVELINNTGNIIPNTFWRFIPQDNYEYVIIRDADSRLSMREYKAVHEWLCSDKFIHIMRDHPHHGSDFMMAGMWGYKRTSFDIKKDIVDFLSKNSFQWTTDGFYLRSLYNKFSNDVICHDSLRKDLIYSLPFPLKMDENKHFVGEKFYGNNQRFEHYMEWINKIEL
jgi:hypothetical protein